MITTSYPRWNGDYAGVFVHRLSEALAKRGHDVRVLAPHSNGFEQRAIMDSVEVHRFRYFPSSLELAYGSWYVHEQSESTLKRLFLKGRVGFILPPFVLKGLISALKLARGSDVIMSHWVFPSGFIGQFASRKSGIPNIIKVYGGDLLVTKQSPILRELVRALLSSADLVVSNSTVTGSIAQELCGRAVVPIFEGVNQNQFNPSLDGTLIRNKYDIGDSPLVFSLGRFVSYKGFQYLVDAIRILKTRLPQLKAIIGGTGPSWCKIRDLVDSLNLRDCVTLPGFIPNEALPYYYASCDLYVAPSIIDEKGNTEGLNVTILEAMSTGKPVIASRVGGIVDAVGTAGLLVPQKDPTALSEAMIRILLDENLAKDAGSRGRQRILNHFTIDAVAESVISAFEGTLRLRQATLPR